MCGRRAAEGMKFCGAAPSQAGSRDDLPEIVPEFGVCAIPRENQPRTDRDYSLDGVGRRRGQRIQFISARAFPLLGVDEQS